MPDYKTRLSSNEVTIFGIVILLISVVVVIMIYASWPEIDPKTKGWHDKITLFGHTIIYPSDDQRMLLLVALSGGLGGLIHLISSFTNFVGAKKIGRSWTWWYIMRPCLGMLLAIVFYIIYRAGFLTLGTDTEQINLYGLLAISALTGMFSDAASLKLKEIFYTLFRPKDTRVDKIDQSSFDLGKINSTDPPTLETGFNGILKVIGEGFDSKATVFINNKQQSILLQSNVEIQIKVEMPNIKAGASSVELILSNEEGDEFSEPFIIKLVRSTNP